MDKSKRGSAKHASKVTSTVHMKPYFCPLPQEIAGVRPINLAIQGGGAHGAFAWGVIDRLLEDKRLHIEGISGTSAGSMNAVVLASGLLAGGQEAAREKLHDFWWKISQAGLLFNPCKQTPFERFVFGRKMDDSVSYKIFEAITRWFSPYQLNPFNINPLRDVLLSCVDFEYLQTCQVTKLFLSATNVHTGQVKIFSTEEVTPDAVMASACLPTVFKSIEINGEYYWDGGYTGNPALFPFFYNCASNDILIIHTNPIERPAPPIMPSEIFNRVNEISFNSGLLKEFRAIAFIHKLLDENMLKDEYRADFKYILLHSISSDDALSDLSAGTKTSSDWDFLLMLRNRGRAQAKDWLDHNFDKVGVSSTVNLKGKLVGL